MEIVTMITLIIFSTTFGCIGYIFGTKDNKKNIIKYEKEVRTEAELERQKRIEQSFNKLFEYTEDIATRGYGNE